MDDVRSIRWEDLLNSIAEGFRYSREELADRAERLWSEVHRRVRALAVTKRVARFGLDADDIDDLVQDVMVRLLDREVLDETRRARNIQARLATTLQHEAIVMARHKTRMVEAMDLPESTLSPEFELLVRELLSSMSPAEQQLIQMRFWEGKTVKEIGEELGIRNAAAGVRVFRLLSKLRAKLESSERTTVRVLPRGGAEGIATRYEMPSYAPRRELLLVEARTKPSSAKPPKRVISTGFSASASPAEPLLHALEKNKRYYFWIEIGAAVAGSIDEALRELQEFVPFNSVLDVVLFTSEHGVRIDGSVRASFRIGIDGTVRVERPAATPDAGLAGRRLFFSVVTPDRDGDFSMRCSIYCAGALLQSRGITVPVGDSDRAPRAVADFVRVHDLTRARVVGETNVSFMLNVGDGGTHDLRIHGSNFDDSVTLTSEELQDMVGRARNALRFVSWGSESLWTDQRYRYTNSPFLSSQAFRDDLIRLAQAGKTNWDYIVDRLSTKLETTRKAIREATRCPCTIELALRDIATAVVPLAMMYDYGLDTGVSVSKLRVCEIAIRSFADPQLSDGLCFRGECPNAHLRDVVCLGGFWGFRHNLGLPISLGRAPEVPEMITDKDPIASVAVSTDVRLKRRREHVRQIKTMLTPSRVRVSETVENTLVDLKTGGAALVYFYCHGGTTHDGVPYLKVGPDSDDQIRRETLNNYDIQWTKPRALVFINGCHTTDLEPERSIEMVSAFVQNVHASGVIGTEITVFEPLAVAFGQRFIHHFAIRGKSVGEAVRLSRLDVLRSYRNPLGLVYLPFVTPGLKLTA